MQEWVSIYETNECDIRTLDIHMFRRLTSCQWDPWDRGITAWYQSLVNDYLGSSNVGIHKYSPDTSSSQLGIKSLGTRVLRADGHGSRSCIMVCCVFCA